MEQALQAGCIPVGEKRLVSVLQLPKASLCMAAGTLLVTRRSSQTMLARAAQSLASAQA